MPIWKKCKKSLRKGIFDELGLIVLSAEVPSFENFVEISIRNLEKKYI
jgi:hypothetical protein